MYCRKKNICIDFTVQQVNIAAGVCEKCNFKCFLAVQNCNIIQSSDMVLTSEDMRDIILEYEK